MSKLKMISASAGSGKTYSLTREVLEAVVSGIPPERIMAVTFTNKAAAELIERIRHKLVQPEKEWIREMNLTPDKVDQLRSQAASLSDAYIGTVNSICARLLREFAFEAGLSPGIDILPEEEADRLFRLAVSHELRKYYASLSGSARRLGRDGSGKGFQKKPDWQDDVKELVNLARSNGLSSSELSAMAQASVNELTTLLGQKWKTMSKHELQQKIGSALVGIQALADDSGPTKKAIAHLRRVSHALNHGYETWADWSGLASIAAGKRKAKDAKMIADELLDDVREYALKVQGHPDLHADVQSLIEGVFACAAESLVGFDSFKRMNGLMDFVDQESKVLELLDQDAVRHRLAERIDLVMVDEFQDTSPIQLALFTKLSALVRQSVWVGDQKQAIYGFRGADPVLMDCVIGRLPDDQVSVLEHSWRSRKQLVDFANDIFEHAFHPMPAERIRLVAKRQDQAQHSMPLGVWRLHGDNKAERVMALAEGIADLLRNPDQWMVEDRDHQGMRPLRAGDIAVLCRTNAACGQIAETLGEYGVSASYGRGSLFSRPECATVLAGMRLLVDAEDTLALAELVQYLPDHSSASTWLSEVVQNQEEAFQRWRQDPRIIRLLAESQQAVEAGPVELMQMVTDILGVRNDLYGSVDPKQALANLESFEQLVASYQGSCKARHQGASLPGLIYWLYRQDDPGQPEGKGDNTVQVCSYHKSKGLEWPVVILSDLDSSAKYSAFGTNVEASDEFDPEAPLSNRSIRYWPAPLSGKDLPFTAAVEGSDEYKCARETELAERKRLMYVGITRARDYLILTKPVGKRVGDTIWLNELINSEEHSIKLPGTEDKKPSIHVAGKSYECVSCQYLAMDEPKALVAHARHWYLPPNQPDSVAHVPFSVAPSSYASVELEASVGATTKLGERIELSGNVDMTSVGEAVHGFIAADRPGKNHSQRMVLAANMLSGWEVADALTPEQLIAFSGRIHDWVQEQWPSAVVRKEWPMRLRIGEQVAHGWIDMLLELPDGYIVIDHKSYPGADAVEHAKLYAPQLAVYKQAVEQATGKRVLQTVIHMPLQGIVTDVNW